MRGRRDGGAAPHGGGADLCPALCFVHVGGNCRRDDLDAPDLNAPDLGDAPKSDADQPASSAGRPTNGYAAGGPIPVGCSTQNNRPPAPSNLCWLPKSATQRDRLAGRTRLSLQSTDEAADWAHKSMPTKNSFDNARRRDLSWAASELDSRCSATEGSKRGKRRPFKGRLRRAPGHPRPEGSEPSPAIRGRRARRPAAPRGQDHSPARQGSPRIRLQATLPLMRPHGRPTRIHLRFAQPRAPRAQGQRQFHGSGVPAPP